MDWIFVVIIFIVGTFLGLELPILRGTMSKSKPRRDRPEFMSTDSELVLEDTSKSLIEKFFFSREAPKANSINKLCILEVLNEAAAYYGRDMRCIVHLHGYKDMLGCFYEFKAVGLGTFSVCWSSQKHQCVGDELNTLRAVFDEDGTVSLKVADYTCKITDNS